MAKKRSKVFEVGDTPYGLGLFTVEKIKKGALLGRVTGEIFDDPDYQSDYCIDLGQDHSLEPAEPFRFLNHSCEPNCVLVLEESSSGRPAKSRVFVETLRKIQPGEQLTIDYGWPADGAIPCGCGTASCRGWIVDIEEADQIPAHVQALAQ